MTREEAEILGLNDDPSLIVDPIERGAAMDAIAARQADIVERKMQIIRERKFAFCRVLRDGGASKDDIKTVRDVLDRFCRKYTTTFHADARLHAVAEGRRETILLIDDYCELSMEELFNKLA